jgi:acyl-CoA reductase-like NAD-dependent aldehyde dehydrogenase
MYDEVVEELAALAKKAIVGDGATEGTEIGPVQNRQQFEKLKAYLVDAHATGKVVAGGEALERPGYFIPPTIVRDIPDDARLVREEQFGPILPVLRYTHIDDVIARANDSEYGLGGTIWTSNPDRGYQLALKIETGTVWVNKHLDLPPDVRVGGAKQSGVGAELGQDGLHEFTQAKIINMALA